MFQKQLAQGVLLFYVLLFLSQLQLFPQMILTDEASVTTTGTRLLDEKSLECKKIAITFDDGPNGKYTPLLLEGLKERGVHATFFLIGVNVEANKELVLQLQEEGHLLGNHTYHHVEITKMSNEEAYKELESTSELIESITGEQVEYMRPPFGLWQKELEEKVPLIPVMWNVDPLDWTTENVDEIVNKVVTKVHENDIILLHDCYQSSVKAALRIIDILQEEGYEFVTVDQLIAE